MARGLKCEAKVRDDKTYIALEKCQRLRLWTSLTLHSVFGGFGYTASELWIQHSTTSGSTYRPCSDAVPSLANDWAYRYQTTIGHIVRGPERP